MLSTSERRALVVTVVTSHGTEQYRHSVLSSCHRQTLAGRISEGLARRLWLQQGAEAISRQEREVRRQEGSLAAAQMPASFRFRTLTTRQETGRCRLEWFQARCPEHATSAKVFMKQAFPSCALVLSWSDGAVASCVARVQRKEPSLPLEPSRP